MTTWLAIGLCIAVCGFGAIADNVGVDFPENVNTRMGGSRIVSGWEAEQGQWPHQISLRMINSVGGVSACGGSIIHNSWAITAAHCTAGRNIIMVRAGVVNLTRPEYFSETDEWYNHPTYNNNLPSVVQPNDIGLLKLQTPVTWSDNLKPIRIQNSEDMDKNYQDLRLVASGWGLTWTGGSSPENLNWVYQRGISNSACQQVYGNALIVPSTICTVYYNVSSQSTCSGDSGGPLVSQDKDHRMTLIGAASFVSGQGCHVLPAGFCRTGSFHDWYYEVTGINFDWSWNESSSSEEKPDKSSPEEPEKPSSEESDSSSSDEPESSEEPESSSSEEPVKPSTEKPEESDSSSSEEPVKPSTEKPEKPSSEESDSSSSDEPEKPSSEEPDSSSSEEPVKPSTEKPEKPSSEEPDSSSSEEPVKPSTEKPSSEEPDSSSSEESDSSSSEEPVKPSTEKPDKPSSEEPEKPSSEEPDNSSSDEPEKPEKPSSEEPDSSSSDEPEKPEKPSSEEGWRSEEEEPSSFWSWFGRSDRI